MKIRISVIVPVYNVEKYLKKCIDSILAQTFQDFEIICIDDKSEDKSLEILKEYEQKDKRFIIISNKQHKGAGIARNQGIKLAKGKYIQFLDSDDYFEPNLLEEMYNRAEKFQSDLVVCSSKKVDDKGNITERKNPNSPINLYKTPLEKPFNKFDFKNNIFSLLTPVPWNKLYLKELILKNNIKFPNTNICEDIAFVHACVICANKIVAFDKELINYRYNRPNSHANLRSKYAIDVVKSCLELKKFLQSKNLYNEFNKAFIEAFKNHIRWEIAQLNNIEYESFLNDFKKLMPNDWQLFKSALKKDYITLDYLNKIIGNKKVMLWGASFFIQNILNQETKKNPNILGIIDKNEASWGKTIGNYKIYPPESLYNLKPENVIMTIWSNNETAYQDLKKEFIEKYSNIKLMENIFEKEVL